jgi:hypothetical protein
MPDYKEQSRAARNLRDTAKNSLERHTADLRDMNDVASRAAEDLETRKKYRRKRAKSVGDKNQDRKRTLR